MPAIKIKDGIHWVGVLDPDLEVFDVVIPTEHGTTYNSYLVEGTDKCALIEANKLLFKDEYVNTVQGVKAVKDIDCVILNHTEPDHSGCLPVLLEMNPDIEVIYSKTAKSFVENIVNGPFNGRAVGDGDTVELGGRTLTFHHTPFLHWPDTMFTYLVEDGILFPCDFLGAHYCDKTTIFNDELAKPDEAYEAFRFYYSMIMRPYKEHIRNAFTKIDGLDITMVCPSHGPVLRTDLPKYIDWYKEQAARFYLNNPNKQVTIAYATAYGNTKALADAIADGLKETGLIVKMHDAALGSYGDIIDDIEISHGLLIGTPTLNAKQPKPISNLFAQMVVLNVVNRKAGAFGSFGWSGEGVKITEDIMKTLRMKVPQDALKVKMTPSTEELEKAKAWGREFGLAVLEGN